MPPMPAATISPYPTIELLDETAAAAVLHLKPATLRKWRCVGGGPIFVRCGRAVRYDPADLATFIEAGRRASTSDMGNAR